MTRFVAILIFAVAALTHGSAISSESKVKVTGTFTDMAYNHAGGDVLGLEVFVVYTREGYVAVVQGAEGEPEIPVVVPVKVNGNSIQFTIPEAQAQAGYFGDFTGTVTETELRLSLKGHGEPLVLRRGPSYWQ